MALTIQPSPSSTAYATTHFSPSAIASGNQRSAASNETPLNTQDTASNYMPLASLKAPTPSPTRSYGPPTAGDSRIDGYTPTEEECSNPHLSLEEQLGCQDQRADGKEASYKIVEGIGKGAFIGAGIGIGVALTPIIVTATTAALVIGGGIAIGGLIGGLLSR